MNIRLKFSRIRTRLLDVALKEKLNAGLGYPERLRRLRKVLGMTTREFGKLFGKSDSTISQWENGKTEVPEIAIRLLEVFEKEHSEKLKQKFCPACSHPLTK